MITNMLFNIDKIKLKIIKEPYKTLYNDLKNKALKCFNGDFFMGSDDLDPREISIIFSFLYAIEENESFCKKSLSLINYLTKEINGDKGLDHYWKNYYLCIFYQLLKKSEYFKPYREDISKQIFDLSNWIFFDGGSGQNQAPSSNWKALRYSLSGLGYLTTDEKDEFTNHKIYGCYQRVLNYFRTNMGDGFTGIEGDGYTRYAFSGIGPFGILLKNYGLDLNDYIKNGIQEQIMWCHSWGIPVDFKYDEKTYRGLSPDFVTDSPNQSLGSFLGLSFYYLDQSERFGLNRVAISRMKNNHLIDKISHGLIYFIEHFDFEEPIVNPLEIPSWRKVFVEETGNGFITFRNKFEDENDIVASIYGNFRKHSGHQGPDQSAFRIIGLNNIWAIGGGWYKDSDDNGVKHFLRNANTIYPEGHGGPNAEKLHKPFKNTGKLIEAKTINSQEIEGHAIISCFAQNDFDTEGHIRRFAAKFNIGCEAAFIVADTTLNGRYWQLCTAYHNEIECGENWFIIKDPLTGSSMKGHVLHPTKDISIYNGERQRGSEYWFREGIVTKNKYVIVERTDPILGLTEDMITVEGRELKNRGGRNSLFYNRNEEGKMIGPKYDQERDFIVVLTLCKSNQQHPQVTLKGERILSGVSILINDYECYTDLNTMRLGI